MAEEYNNEIAEKFYSKFKSKKYKQAFKSLENKNTEVIENVLDKLIAENKLTAQKVIAKYYKERIVSYNISKYFYTFHYEVFISETKINKAFFFLENFGVLSKLYENCTNLKYKEIFKEFEYLHNIWLNIENEKKKFDSLLSRTSFEKLLVQLSIVLEIWRFETNQEKSLHGNIDNIANVFSHILNRKIELQNNLKPIENLWFMKIFDSVIKNMNNFDKSYWDLFIIYDKYDAFLYLAERYCFYDFYLSFESNNKCCMKPQNNSDLINWKRNGEKYKHKIYFYRNYFQAFANKEVDYIENLTIPEYNKEGAVRDRVDTIYYLDSFLGDSIKFKNNSFKAVNFIRLLNSISVFSDINWSSLINRRLLENIDNNPLEAALTTIQNNTNNNALYKGNYGEHRESYPTPLHCRNYNELCALTTEIDKIEEEETMLIYDFVTSNLNLQQTGKIDLLKKPFIKFGKNIFWFSEIMTGVSHSKNLANFAFRHYFLNDKEEINKHTVIIEKQVEEYFTNAGFETRHEHKHSKRGIDVLAYKDNVMFPIQIKATFGRATVSEIYRHNRDAMTKAKQQIVEDIKYLRSTEGKKLVCKLFNLPEDTDYEIFPIIATTTFEEEGKMFEIEGMSVPKVSVFELKIILGNLYPFMTNPETILEEHFNGNIPESIVTELTLNISYIIRDSSIFLTFCSNRN